MHVLVIAIGPAIALAVYFYNKDKYEKEPFGLLSKSFLAGFVATFFALIIEYILMNLLVNPVQGFFLKIFLKSFLVAALVEEGLKFLVFRGLIYDNNEFNEPYDGIVYAVMISLGFATLENLMYVAAYTYKLGFSGLLTCGIGRAMFAVPAHAFDAVIMGYYLGLAKFSKENALKRSYMCKALCFAILAHGLYDLFLFSNTGIGTLYMLILLVFCWNFSLKAIKIQVEKSQFRDR